MTYRSFVCKPGLLLAAACASIFTMHDDAVAQAAFPLYCQGPLKGEGFTAPFKWSKEGAGSGEGTQYPGQGECAWADRGPRGTEIQTNPPPGNKLCLPGPDSMGLNWFSLAAGQYYEWCAYRDAKNDNCMNVSPTILGTMIVHPPFDPEPVCAK